MLPDMRLLVLGVLGLSAGGVIAAGIFAFLAVIGVFPRLIGKTKTRNRILLYETCIVVGGVIGNLIDVYEFPIPMGMVLGTIVLLLFGLGAGIFVGCLVMSLAETLDALPVLSRRIHLAVGLQYIILSVAFGKMLGSFAFFWYGIGSS